jgi:hypothetical protein
MCRWQPRWDTLIIRNKNARLVTIEAALSKSLLLKQEKKIVIKKKSHRKKRKEDFMILTADTLRMDDEVKETHMLYGNMILQ